MYQSNPRLRRRKESVPLGRSQSEESEEERQCCERCGGACNQNSLCVGRFCRRGRATRARSRRGSRLRRGTGRCSVQTNRVADEARKRLEGRLIAVDNPNRTLSARAGSGVIEPNWLSNIVVVDRYLEGRDRSAIIGVAKAGVKAVDGEVRDVRGFARGGECGLRRGVIARGEAEDYDISTRSGDALGRESRGRVRGAVNLISSDYDVNIGRMHERGGKSEETELEYS